jgi:tetratricopeptide (TPR) repeat protein
VLFAVPWLALLALELGLRVFGYGVSMDVVLRQEVDGQPRYLSNPHFTWRFFEPGAARLLPPFSLATRKPPGTCRVFVLGGSAAQGDPEPGFGLARMLEVLLRDQYPGVAFEVVNAAPTAVNSHVVYAMAKAAVNLEPDALVVYSGHNEVVGPYGAGTVLTAAPPSLTVLRAGVALRATRLGQLTAGVVGALAGGKHRPPEESWRGMGMFLERQVRLFDPSLERTYQDYERNLTDTCKVASRAGVPLVLGTVAVKLRDWGPFASLNAETLTADERRRFTALVREGTRLLDEGEAAAAWDVLEKAREIDAGYAELLYRLGRVAWALGRFDDARDLLREARDRDTLRFRADTRTNTIVREVARREAGLGVRLADAEVLLGEHVPHGTPGDEAFLDHVHLTFLGHYRVSIALFEELREVLPDWVREKATGQPPLSEEECARWLVFTELDRYLIAETMQKRLQAPPFTGQVDHLEHVRRFAGELETLRARGESGAVEAVVQQYETALADERAHWSVRERYATIQRRAGALDVAEREWRQLAQQFPQYPSFQLQLAHTLREAGRHEEAEASLRKVLEYREEPSTLVELARVIALQGRRTDAIAVLERVRRLTATADPNHERAREALEALRGS